MGVRDGRRASSVPDGTGLTVAPRAGPPPGTFPQQRLISLCITGYEDRHVADYAGFCCAASSPGRCGMPGLGSGACWPSEAVRAVNVRCLALAAAPLPNIDSPSGFPWYLVTAGR